MKKLLFTVGTVAVLALASCSNDETVSSSPVNPNEISFNVVANNASRAADLYSTTVLPSSFYVFANETGTATPYFALDKATKGASATTYTLNGGVRYWPDSNSGLDFFAFTGAYKDNAEITSASGDVTNGVALQVNIPAAAASQHDLLYASTPGATKGSNGEVSLNFRHALAQLAFKANNKSRSIYVQVQKVELYNVIDGGTVTFGKQTTATNYTYAVDNTYTYSNHCSWTLGSSYQDQSLTGAGVAVYPGWENDAVKDIDAVAIENTADNNDVMFVVPQDVKTWDPETETSGATAVARAKAAGKMVFYVYARIQNVADPSTGTPGTYLYGDSGYKAIAIPVSSDVVASWEAGKKYIYTFIFGATNDNGDPGNGGIDPDNPDNPVLVPIKISTQTISVDDYAIAGTQTIDMKK